MRGGVVGKTRRHKKVHTCCAGRFCRQWGFPIFLANGYYCRATRGRALKAPMSLWDPRRPLGMCAYARVGEARIGVVITCRCQGVVQEGPGARPAACTIAGGSRHGQGLRLHRCKVQICPRNFHGWPPGTDGPLKTRTLGHIMAHLPVRSAGGIVCARSGLYVAMNSAAARPFIDFFFENKPALAGAPPLDTCAHRLLVSSRGVGTDKKGNGLRPIPSGDALRRITAQCAILQSKGQLSAIELADEPQCGAGIKGGVDIGYALPIRVPGALAAARIPPAMLITDGVNAHNAINQDKVTKGLVVVRPDLVGFCTTCYGEKWRP